MPNIKSSTSYQETHIRLLDFYGDGSQAINPNKVQQANNEVHSLSYPM